MPAIDDFEHNGPGLSSPLQSGFAIAPSDSAELAHVTRELYVGSAGDVTLLLKSGDEIALLGVPAGSRLPYRIRAVKATGTTASNLVGLY